MLTNIIQSLPNLLNADLINPIKWLPISKAKFKNHKHIIKKYGQRLASGRILLRINCMVFVNLF